MRGATRVSLQLHQILRLPRKMNLRIDPAHIWNVIYHVRRNKRQPPKYCPCHAKWISWLIRLAYETSFTMRGATSVSLQLHQILRLPHKMNLMIDPSHIWRFISALILLTYETSFTMRDATKGSLPLHKILRLPRKMNLMIDPSHIWNVIYDNARCNKSQPPTPPNTAPATKNESQDWSCSHLKRHLPCVEQQHSPSNLTK